MYYRTVPGQITELTREGITQSHATSKEKKNTPIKSEAGRSDQKWRAYVELLAYTGL